MGSHGLPRQRSRPNLANPIPAPPTVKSPTLDTPSTPLNAGLNLRAHLQSLLEQKSTQLQKVGTMGQQILEQQAELEARIRGLEEDDRSNDNAEIGEVTRNKLMDLDQAMKGWDSQNEGLIKELGGAQVSYVPTRLWLVMEVNLRSVFTVSRFRNVTIHPTNGSDHGR